MPLCVPAGCSIHPGPAEILRLEERVGELERHLERLQPGATRLAKPRPRLSQDGEVFSPPDSLLSLGDAAPMTTPAAHEVARELREIDR